MSVVQLWWGMPKCLVFSSALPLFPATQKLKLMQWVKANADRTTGFFSPIKGNWTPIQPQRNNQVCSWTQTRTNLWSAVVKSLNCFAVPRSGTVPRSAWMGRCRVHDMWGHHEGRWHFPFLAAGQVSPGHLGRNLPGSVKGSSSYLAGMFSFQKISRFLQEVLCCWVQQLFFHCCCSCFVF